MSLEVPCSSVSRSSKDINGLILGDEKTVQLTNTSLNVENSTVHIGNVIHHHVYVPSDQVEPQKETSSIDEDASLPDKTPITENESRSKYDILIKNKKTKVAALLVFGTVLLTVILLIFIYVPNSRETTPNSSETKPNSSGTTPSKDEDDKDSDPKPSDSFGNLTELGGCRIFEEENWGIKRNLDDVVLKHPVPLIIISHSATPFCNSTKACKWRMKQIQEYHISTGKLDIGYNFMVGGDGNIYVGRGWNARNFHLGNHSIGIDLIGNFFRDEFQPKMEQCVKAIIGYGVEAKILEDDYKIVCHNQTNKKLSSPGPNVYAKVKKWPHFMPGEVSWSYLYGV